MTQPETIIRRAQRAALVRTGHLLLWVNPVGKDRETHVRYGLGLGSPDLLGILRTGTPGRLFGLETKTPVGRLSENQKRWHRVARAAGAFVAVARSEAEALEALGRALMGKSE